MATTPEIEPEVCERARLSRDPRFDGRFFVGVRSTGIFCRPTCPVKLPKAENVEFFRNAALAFEQGYRPCLRCRPELAPGNPYWPVQMPLVQAALARIEAGQLQLLTVESLAAELGIGARHLRRLLQQAIGTSPKQLIQTRRILFAKQLISDTELSMVQIAEAAGFASQRRFNAVFRQFYRVPPTALRRPNPPGHSSGKGFTLHLHYRPPYPWSQVRNFLQDRAISGLENVTENSYQRTIAHKGQVGRIRLTHQPERSGFLLQVDLEQTDALYGLAQTCRRVLDLDSVPQLIQAHLSQDARLSWVLKATPGLRLPLAWDRFELCVRAVVGQQISVAAARTVLTRLLQRCNVERPSTSMLFPGPETLLRHKLNGLGLTQRRINTLHQLAQAVIRGDVPLYSDNFTAIDAGLAQISGIGPWTRAYIGMRALGDPDAWPQGDIVLRRALAGSPGESLPTASRMRQIAAPWRPWRAYAAMTLWQGAHLRRAGQRLSPDTAQ